MCYYDYNYNYFYNYHQEMVAFTISKIFVHNLCSIQNVKFPATVERQRSRLSISFAAKGPQISKRLT